MADVTQLLSQFLYSRLPQVGGSGGSASGVLTVSTTSAATIADTNETTLWTYTMPANTLDINGRLLRIAAWGSLGATANAKTVRLYFGATVLQIYSAGTGNGLIWRTDAIVARTSATAQIANATLIAGSAMTSALNPTPAETLSGAVTIKITGQNGSAVANDVVFNGAVVELIN